LRSSQIGESFKVRPGHFNSLVHGHTAFSKGDNDLTIPVLIAIMKKEDHSGPVAGRI